MNFTCSLFAATALASAFAINNPATAQGEPTVAQSGYAALLAHNDESQRNIDWKPYNDFMNAFAVRRDKDRTKLYYTAIRSDGKQYLDNYIAGVAQIPFDTLSRDVQLAYWLNLRNLLVVQGVAEEAKRSLKKQRGDAAAPGEMWTKKRVTIKGVNLSIDDIEGRIILANWDNPDILYGLYQGVAGGPMILERAFTSATAEQDLQELARAYVNNRDYVRVRRDEAEISSFYYWYKPQIFSNDDTALIEHLKAHADPDLAEDLASVQSLDDRRFNYQTDEFVVRQQQAISPGLSVAPGGGS